MSPSNVEMFQSDCSMNRKLKFSATFDFTSTSSDAGRFDWSKMAPELPNTSGRIKPRLMKMRKKHVLDSRDVLKSQGTDSGVDGITGVSDEFKAEDGFERAFTDRIQSSGLNSSKENGDLNETLEQFGACGLGFDLSSGNGNQLTGRITNTSEFKFNSSHGKNMFASNRISPNLDAKEKYNPFIFCGGTGNPDSRSLNSMLDSKGALWGKETDQDIDGYVFHVGKCDYSMHTNFRAKEPRGKFRQLKVGNTLKFEGFVCDKNVSASNVSFEQQDSNICRQDEKSMGVEKSKSANFVFGASKLGSGHDVGKVTGNYVFGSSNCDSEINRDLQNIPVCQNAVKFDIKDAGKQIVGIETTFRSNFPNGVFTFRGLKNNEVSGTEGNHTHDQVKIINAEDCNSDFGFDNHEIGSVPCYNITSSNSVDALQKNPAFKLCDDMKRMNVDDFEGDTDKSKNTNDRTSVYKGNMFVFGKTISGSVTENNPIDMNASNSLHDNVGLSKFSPFVSPVRTSYFVEASMSKDENDGIRFTSKLSGLHSADKNFSLPNMKFSFSGVDKVKNSKSIRSKRSHKKNKRLGQKKIIQNFSRQDHVPKEDSSEKNESTKFGSPVDFSPCQNSVAKSQTEAVEALNEGKPSGNILECHGNLNISSSLPTQNGLSAIRKQYRKKYKLKVVSDDMVQVDKSGNENAKKGINGLATSEICEDWRTRGNQAYHLGNFSKAEKFYSMGINSISHAGNLGCSKKPLLLCYSNRAAARMTLGRMREAIEDCKLAASLDSSFLKVTLRAGNCHLILGEVDDAIICYNKCLELEMGLCLDRRITIQATDGLQKATRVSNFMLEAEKFLLEGTQDSVSHALGYIMDALSISRYSEKLLEMKGRALCIMQMYGEVIQLCEQTLDIAEKNFILDRTDDSSCKHSHVSLWRWYLQSKSHYHLGRVDVALDLLEQHVKRPMTSRFGDAEQVASVGLASSIRELLSLKMSGNEAFRSGKFTEAVEHYTVAISKSLDSHPFMAICFCNRAAAYQSTNQIVDAIADCSLAIALDENYQKAISRRATLYEMIRDYKQTSYDLQKLISLLQMRSPEKNRDNDSQSRSRGSGNVRDLRKARSRLSKVEERAKMEIPIDFYLILGVKASDTDSEIKKAYRKAALRHHPDKASQILVRSDVGDTGTLWKEVGEKIHTDAEKRFKIIGEAYAVLSDSLKRAKYDKEEEMRNVFKDSIRNCQSGHSSASANSPFERGSWSERQKGSASSSRRNAGSRHWHEQWRPSNF